MFTYILYTLAIVLLTISFLRDKGKTKMALLKAWRSFENILPQFLGIIILIGIMLAILSPKTISDLLGKQSGWIGMILAAAVGAITLIPGFVAFPLAAALLKNGAGYMQIGIFISTLMMVGIVTLPLETQYFGKKVAYTRNALAFAFSFLVAIIIGVVMR